MTIRTDDSAEISIHGLFEEQVERTPAAVAVAFGADSLSYAELNRRANRLAHHLRRLGVRPDGLVGLAAERSLEMVVGVLAALKAGGAYVPLDPGYPAERLSFMWQDVQSGSPTAPPVLLCQRRLAGVLPADLTAESGGRVLFLDDPGAPAAPAGEGGCEENPRAEISPDQLAYVIYTSGSTGRPKGVLVPHRGVVNVIREAARLLAVGPGSRVLQLASLGFDASALEIFTALATGACLVLTRRETLMSGEALGRELAAQAVSVLAIPPSLLDTVEKEDLPALRAIIVGGEACSAATAARWSAGRTLVNAYAPTEATIFATAAPLAPPITEAPAIGRPIAGIDVVLLDADGEAVADGEAGELCLGGVGVVRGYLNRPELTAERFIPDGITAGGRRSIGTAPEGRRSIGTAPEGRRLYRSGDLARRLADGGLQFIGRVDHQVKVRGYRIELGEIEAVLGQHAGVQTAVVVAREDGRGTAKRLVAYVVRRREGGSGRELTVSALRSFLAGKLPDYMVPTAFVFLAAMPMTPTGKVDRRALPAPGQARPELDADFVAPRDAAEEALARIWSELLGVDPVGVHDNLFELGGHSLIAAQIANRVREELGVELAIPEVFERPTVAALAGRLAELAKGGPGNLPAAAAMPTIPPIVPVPRDGPLPLSFSQERVWFLNQLAPGSVAYNFQFTLRLRGALDPPALQKALEEIVARHEILRTSFPAVGGGPVQVIHPPWEVDLPLVDLRLLPLAERQARAERLVHDEIRKPFDVTRIPLLRWTLLRLGDGDHLLLHVEHHFVHDGWSLAVFLRELKELYTAFAAGRLSPLLPLPVQYADFAVWQRRWLQGEVLRGQMDYWKERLRNPATLELPTDHPRPKAYSFRGGALRVDMPPALYAALRAFSRREGTTLFMAMLSAFYTLLYRYTGQDDILLGSGIANRRTRETEGLIGMVVNTVVLRTAFSGEESFRRLLVRVRETSLAAHVHQDLPFEKLVEELQPDRELSRNPLFQVLFSFHDAPVPDLDFAGLTGDIFERHNGSAKSDLNVVVKPRAEQRVGLAPAGGEELTMVWEYSSDLFERATVERMWERFQVLLAGIVEDAGRPLADLPLLTAAELAELAEWDSTAVPFPGERHVLALFEAQAARTPRALAVAAGDLQLTYGDLDCRAGLLAAELRALGAGPEVVVALLTERSPEMAVAALGILKTGGAYLPLDPAYPPERLAYMLEDAGAAAVVVRRDLLPALPATALPVLAIDAGAEIGDLADLNGVPTAADPGQLAYVIYTSGSTGRPKGVEISHAGLANLVAWHQRTYGVTADDRATLLAGPAFDASVWELWPYLTAGASLHVPDADTRSSPERLLAWLAAEGITLSFLPTPLAEALVERVEHGNLPQLALRALLTGGDRLHRAPRRGLPFRLHNHYGPTESTVVSTATPVPAAAEPAEPGALALTLQPPPAIGRPIANLQVRLLDRSLGRAPLGVPGELAVGGAGLARGYRGRPDLTAERFVPDPWGAPGSRLYRTGDLARHLAAGDLEFLGRSDHQVKIRGFRVELGEIESVLAEHSAVAEAVVVARETPGGPALAAYAVPAAGADLSPEDLRLHLAAKLPAYMVPAGIVVLAALPLTPNGKVDRRALPAPDLEAGARESGFTAPRTPLEELLAGIWREVIGVAAVSVHDNFFKLGGHSLIATRMLSRVRDAVEVELPLSALFEAPTVADLALPLEELLRQGAGGALETATLRIEPRGGHPPGPAGARHAAPLSFSQERLWFLDQLAPGSSAYTIARAFTLRGPLDLPALARSLAEIVRRHETLRTTFAAVDDRPVQLIAAAGPFGLDDLDDLDVVDLGGISAAGQSAEADRLRSAEARRPFDLERGPLLRAILLRAGGGLHQLVLTMHHIVSDGWSMSLFLAELAALYGAFARGRASPLAPLPIQYADFALWQRQRLRDGGPALAGLLAYWRRQLAGAPAVLELPADRPRPPLQSFRGDVARLDLPPATAAAIRDLAHRAGATPFIALLAALTALLDRLGPQGSRRDVSLGSPIAGRNRSEVERLIGFFVNTLVLRTRWEPEASFRDLLARARQTTLAAHAHQELPFEQLVAELAPERHLGHTPLFQVLFTLQSAGAPPSLPGLELAPAEVTRRESRFDLEIEVAEGAEADGMAMRWRYDSDLFDPPTVARLAGHFATLLAAVLAAPDRQLAEVPLLSDSEAHQLLVEWNDTAPAAAEPACLQALFAAQAARTPEAVAVAHGERELSYGELDRRSNRLARRLRALGVGPEVPVGVLLARSPEMVVALLGILKAGGLYVPFDPAYPEDRLAFMLEDSRARVVVALEQLLPKLPAPVAERGLAILCLDRDRAAIAAESGEALGSSGGGGAVAGNLAYAIYTSGSTGRPKGVAIEHRSAAALLAWARGVFADADVAAVFAATSICFDLSVFELFVPLTRGGTVVLGENALELGSQPGAARVSLVNTVPSAMAELLRMGALPASVRTVNLAGEPLSTRLVDAILRQTPAARVFDLYGPSEDTTYSTFARRDAAGPATIGRPIAGTRAYLLDRAGLPVPPGVAGELCLAGDGLARGYLRRPELTAEKFLPDPFAAGGRLYRTGDLARARADGRLEFLGRLDHQVKVRGFRIELQEIESLLERHPAIREAVVVAREDRPGERRLVAYTAAVPEAEDVGAAELRAHLAAQLPEYMVPSVFVPLPVLPRTPNGKVDRQALPAPDAGRPELEQAFVAAETADERSLAGIWAEVLGVERVGVQDDFFRLGGHSLLATRVIARLRRDFQVDLPLRSLFQAPTVRGLLAAVAEARSRQAGGHPFGAPAAAPQAPPQIARAGRAAARRTRPAAGRGGDSS